MIEDIKIILKTLTMRSVWGLTAGFFSFMILMLILWGFYDFLEQGVISEGVQWRMKYSIFGYVFFKILKNLPIPWIDR